MLRIIIEKGDPQGAVFVLHEGENLVGRSRAANIRVNAPDVSGRHAEILVDRDKATLRNLSQFGTCVDGHLVSGDTVLVDGQSIEVGKGTLLRLSDDPDAAMGEDGTRGLDKGQQTSMPSQMGDQQTLPATLDGRGSDKQGDAPIGSISLGKPQARPMTPPQNDQVDDAADQTGFIGPADAPTGDHEPESDGATHAMETRMATPEEIAALKIAEQKRARQKLYLASGLLLPIVATAIWYFWPPEPEPYEIDWSKDAQGNYQDAFAPAPGGGREAGGYDVMYPGNGTFVITPTDLGFICQGRVGHAMNIPVRIILGEENDVSFIKLNRDELIRDWMRKIAEDGGKWNFDKPSNSPIILGRNNGVPCFKVAYFREDGGGIWYGSAFIVRRGTRRIVVRMEVPESEQSRVDQLMGVQLLWFSENYEYAQWEAVPLEKSAVSLERELAQASKELERLAPATWVAQEAVLMGILTASVNKGNQAVEKEALALLTALRQKQALWFNGQRFAFDAAIMRNEIAKARKLAEFAKAVFSNVEDSRYSKVRKWESEL